VRGWVSKLTPEQARFIEKWAGETLVRMGYPLLSELNAEALLDAEAANHVRDIAVGV
jgi:hypothetical protein